jgi:PAS domain S-box-containing protein|tara:strand:- start:32 stop:1552 length:1521 start_codon:yes stop_codon:yes gene_type:complete
LIPTKNIFVLLALFALLSVLVYARIASTDIFWAFREIDGSTNWQYVSNFSSSLLIIALSITAIRLAFTRRTARRYNLELEEIRSQLEDRVKERTATLDEANVLLQDSNNALEEEIDEHLETTTRLRLSESYITSILRSMPLMLIGLNKQGEITQWNSCAEEISGLPANTVLGKNLWEAYPTMTVTPAQIKKAQDEDKTLTIKYSQRGQFHFDITIYPLHDQRETGVVILVDDVTQRVQSENMLIQRDKMSSMGEMAAIMAHDINIPLQAIMKDVQTVRQDLTEEHIDPIGLNELLEDALIRGRQASTVIQNLVTFSDSGAEEKQYANITQVMDHSIELAEDVLSVTKGLRFKDVVINKNYADDLPELNCHASKLQQVFLSLFRYACHALGKAEDPQHIPIINIEISEFYDALWVRVQHNGLGISIEDQQYIFEPFFSNDQAKAETGSTSTIALLGNKDKEHFDAGDRLSFAHFIITEQHQGQIAVTSDIDIGTTFHIQLPLKIENT